MAEELRDKVGEVPRHGHVPEQAQGPRAYCDVLIAQAPEYQRSALGLLGVEHPRLALEEGAEPNKAKVLEVLIRV